MGKASISIAISGSYNGAAVERAQKSLDRLAVKTAAASDSMAAEWAKQGGELADLGGRIHGMGSDIEGVGRSLTAGITVPLATAGAGALAAGVDFDNAGATIRAACGGATKEAKNLEEAGRTLYADGWGESMTQLSSSLVRAREILGDLSETDMSYAVEGAMTLEKAYGSDFAESLRGVNVLVDKFGLSATEATDLMVSGTQRGLDYTKELGDNLAEYAGRWADAEMTASQYFSLLEAGAQGGAYQLDKVGDFLNEFLTSLTDGRMEAGIGYFSQGTKDAFESFKAGGATAEDVLNSVLGELSQMPDGYQRAQISSELWSTLGEDNAMSMITALAGVNDTFADVGGAAKQAGDELGESLGNRATSALRTAQEAVMPFASVAVDMLGDAADTAKGAAQGFSELDGSTQGMIVGMAALAAAAPPLLTVGGKMAQAVGNVVTAVGRAKQSVGVYADALTTTNVASLKAYQGNEKLAKVLERNPAAKAAGGVQQYIDAVTKANVQTSRYNAAAAKLAAEQRKGSKANADLVSSLQKEVAGRRQAVASAKANVDGYKAAASAAKANTAAVKAQSVAMKAAAVAASGMRVAMAAIAPAAVISGIVAIAGAFAKANEEERRFAAATDGLVAATREGISASSAGASALEGYGSSAQVAKADIDGMLQSQAELAGAIRDTNTTASAQMSQLQQAYSTIQQYANHADLANDAQARLRTAVETVNEMCGTQIEVTDAANGALADENGAIQDVTGSLEGYVEKKLEQIKIDAQQQNLTALYQQQATDIAALTQAQMEYNAAWGDMDARASDYYDMMVSQGVPITMEQARATMEATAASSEEAKKVQAATDALEASNTAIENVSSSMTAQAAATDAVTASIGDLAMASPAVSTAMTAAGKDVNDFASDLANAGVSVETFRGLNESELSTLVAAWDGTGQSIVDALNVMGKGMNDEGLSAVTALANGMTSGAVSVEVASEAVKAAASGDWSGVAAAMYENGTSLPQSVSDAISANGFKPTEATGAMLSAIALRLAGGDAVAAAQILGGNIDEGLAAGIMNGSLSDEQAAVLGQDVIDKVKETLESHSPSLAFYRIGTDVDEGLGLGISGNSSSPLTAIGELGRSLLLGLAGLPAQLAGTGGNAAGGLSKGLSSGVSAVGSSAAGLYGKAVSSTMGTPDALSGYGIRAGSLYASGIAAAKGSTSSAAQGVARAAEGMRNVGNPYTWGSHLSSNFADGIRAGIGWVSSAASAIANAAKGILGFSVPDSGPWSGAEKGGETSGLHLAQNFAKGMESGTAYVSRAADGLMRSSMLDGAASFGVGSQAARPGGSHAVDNVLLAQLLEEVKALRGELGQVIADNAPRFPSDRRMREMVLDYVG